MYPEKSSSFRKMKRPGVKGGERFILGVYENQTLKNPVLELYQVVGFFHFLQFNRVECSLLRYLRQNKNYIYSFKSELYINSISIDDQPFFILYKWPPFSSFLCTFSLSSKIFLFPLYSSSVYVSFWILSYRHSWL